MSVLQVTKNRKDLFFQSLSFSLWFTTGLIVQIFRKLFVRTEGTFFLFFPPPFSFFLLDYHL